jgi:hypothetical protein
MAQTTVIRYAEICEFAKQESIPVSRSMDIGYTYQVLPYMHIIIKVVLPVSTASAERSFSDLRRFKTYP